MFYNDLRFGKRYENKFLEYLDFDEYDEVEVCPDGRFTLWDIRIKKGDKYTTYEIKADKRAKATGNVCIEYECNGTPSGITTSASDYYGYFVVGKDEECYIIPTSVLREECLSPYIRTISCGDGGRVRAFLLPIHLFSEYKVEKKR